MNPKLTNVTFGYTFFIFDISITCLTGQNYEKYEEYEYETHI